MWYQDVNSGPEVRNGQDVSQRPSRLAGVCFAKAKLRPGNTEGTPSPDRGASPRVTRDSFSLYREVKSAARILETFSPSHLMKMARSLAVTRRLFVTGEGSSLLVPGGMAANLANGILGGEVVVQSRSSGDVKGKEFLNDTVLVVTNSGESTEPVDLAARLFRAGHRNLFVATAHPNSTIVRYAIRQNLIPLWCGSEVAVAASKSLVEQSLITMGACALACNSWEKFFNEVKRRDFGQLMYSIVTAQQNIEAVQKIVNAKTIYVSGPDDGIAAEVFLKGPEITGKKTILLPGSLSGHGPLEAHTNKDLVLFVNSTPTNIAITMAKLGPSAPVIVIGDRLACSAAGERAIKIEIPADDIYSGFFALSACWNVFMDAGIELGRNLDKPRKLEKVATPKSWVDGLRTLSVPS